MRRTTSMKPFLQLPAISPAQLIIASAIMVASFILCCVDFILDMKILKLIFGIKEVTWLLVGIMCGGRSTESYNGARWGWCRGSMSGSPRPVVLRGRFVGVS
ncbi:hypothetical protein RND81_10G068800 [Saponaria officinalis]|uniref:Uncharacterized protein n=1 Tax=Saponaria officinalis TaxID=3572 RepID=A0AAW1HZ17_SAPOF